jgi:hypothetical protein
MKCKICNQEAGWIYPFFNYGRCVHCKCTIERRLDTTPLSKEWLEYSKRSEKACDEWLKEHPNG